LVGPEALRVRSGCLRQRTLPSVAWSRRCCGEGDSSGLYRAIAIVDGLRIELGLFISRATACSAIAGAHAGSEA